MTIFHFLMTLGALRPLSLNIVKVKVMLRPSVSRPVSLVVKHPSGAQDQILLLSDTCVFVDVGRPLWREDGSVIYDCCLSSPPESFSGPSPAGLVTIIYCLRFGTRPTWGPDPRIYNPQEQGDDLFGVGD
jgi:hypothetical protein